MTPTKTLVTLSSAALILCCSQIGLAAEQSWANNMSNQELLAAAKAQLNDQHCPTQNALNQQWLNQHNGSYKAKVGNKAIQYIAKQMLRSYMGDKKSVQFSDTNTKTVAYKSAASKKNSIDSFSAQKLDYGLKLSGNKFKLAVNYAF